MPKKHPLCYVLLDKSGRYAWHGPGFRLLEEDINLKGLPTWPSRQEARQAADALKRVLGIDPVVTPVFLR